MIGLLGFLPAGMGGLGAIQASSMKSRRGASACRVAAIDRRAQKRSIASPFRPLLRRSGKR